MRPLGAAEPLVGLASLGTSAKGEFILLVAATGAEVESEGAGAYAVVKAAFSFLVSRARVAMGEIGVHAPISVREQEVLEHLIIGKSVRQIAIELGRSPHTVHDHVKNLHRKLNASSRGELIARALGFVPRATRIRDASRPERETPIVDPDRVDGAW
jgi:DNA-binding CsgD family transcriptional regulator